MNRNLAIVKLGGAIIAVFLSWVACAVAADDGPPLPQQTVAEVPPLPLETVADVPLPVSAAPFDYESLDPERHLLFIAQPGGNEVVAVDTRRREIVGRIGGLAQVHEVLVVPALQRVFASETGSDQVAVIDELSGSIKARIPAGRGPDGMSYVPAVHKLYVSDDAGATETVIDTHTDRVVHTIALDGEAGDSQYDPVSRRVIVNIQSRGELDEIDPVTDGIRERYWLSGASGNHALLIEPQLRLAFIACRKRDELLVLDLRTGDVTGNFHVGENPDELAYDAASGLLYVAGEAGVVSMFHLDGRHLVRAGEGLLAPTAHAVAIDAKTHETYFPIAGPGLASVLRIDRLAP